MAKVDAHVTPKRGVMPAANRVATYRLALCLACVWQRATDAEMPAAPLEVAHLVKKGEVAKRSATFSLLDRDAA